MFPDNDPVEINAILQEACGEIDDAITKLLSPKPVNNYISEGITHVIEAKMN